MARILVIDDDTSLLQMIRVMLEREGHQVLLAEGGEAGLSVALSQNPDLAIIDLMMPGMSGYSITRSLRADPRMEHLPILILTARGQPMDRQMALDAGANAHLAKPITANDLIGRVTEMLAHAPNRGEEPPLPKRRPIGATAQLTPSNPPTPGPMIVPAPVGLRGGAGTTTIAVNLALALRERRGRVCLVDLSMAGGHVGLHLHMATKPSWGDLLNGGDTLDPRSISAILVPHSSTGLTVLPAPSIPGIRALSQPAMSSLLETLTGGFQQIAVDVSSLTPAAVAALLASYVVVVVTSDDVMSVHTTSNMMQTLQMLGVEMGRVRVTVNHSRPDVGVPLSTILRALGRPISAEIPYDPVQVQAMRRGTPLVLSTPDSAFTKAIQQLIRTF